MSNCFLIQTSIERDGEDYSITLAIFSTREKAELALPAFQEEHWDAFIVESVIDPSIPTKPDGQRGWIVADMPDGIKAVPIPSLLMPTTEEPILLHGFRRVSVWAESEAAAIEKANKILT